MSILYNPSKANIVFDALSRLSMASTAYFEIDMKELARLGTDLNDWEFIYWIPQIEEEW